MLLKIIKLKSKIAIRNLPNLIRKENLVNSIIYIIGIFLFANILLNTFIFNKSLLKNSNIENIEKLTSTFKNQLIIFLVVFIAIIIYRIYKIYIKEDKDLAVLPLSDNTNLFYNLIKILIIIIFFDLLFIIFNLEILLKLSKNLFFSFIFLMLFQFLLVFLLFYFIYKILCHKKIFFLLLVFFLALMFLSIIIYSNYTLFHLSLIKKYFFDFPSDYFINIVLLRHNNYSYLFFNFISFALICFLYKKIKHNLNPLKLSSIRDAVYTDLFPKGNEEDSKKESLNKHLQIYKSVNKHFIMKDIRILFREVGFRFFVISMFILLLTIFALDLMKEGKLILGKLVFLLILGYFVLLNSWLIALPSVGGEGLFFGFIRNSINLRRFLKAKLIFSFMVNSFFGFIISLFAMIIFFKNGFLDLKFFILILFSIAEFSFVLSYSGVTTGSFFPNFKDKSKERIKKSSLAGQIVFFVSGPLLIILVVFLNILFFQHVILFLAGVVITNITVILISHPLLKGAALHLNRVEL